MAGCHGEVSRAPGKRNAGAGSVKTLTFDKRAARLPQFSFS
jgi:hypothetical protein